MAGELLDGALDHLLAVVGFALVVLPGVATVGSLLVDRPLSNPAVGTVTVLTVAVAAVAFVRRSGSFPRLGAFVFWLCATATGVGLGATALLAVGGYHGFLSAPAFPAAVAVTAYLVALARVYARPADRVGPARD